MAFWGSSPITLALLTELFLSTIPLKTAPKQKPTRKTLEMNVLRCKSPVLAAFRRPPPFASFTKLRG